jgi:protease-4
VRVASGGGEIGASHAMAEAVLKAKKDKPVYVSMGDVAASGGYYLAAPASKIFASPTTLTGSIGVFLGSVHLEGLYEKIGLRKETLSRAPLAEIDSEARRWGAAERAVYQRRLDEYYGLFTAFVAAQRKLSAEAVEKAAQGRVWLGRGAQSLGLVDGLGGLDATLDALAAATGNELARTDVRLYRRARGLFDLDLSEAVGVSLDGLPDGVRAAFDLATRTREPFWFYEPLRLD